MRVAVNKQMHVTVWAGAQSGVQSTTTPVVTAASDAVAESPQEDGKPPANLGRKEQTTAAEPTMTPGGPHVAAAMSAPTQARTVTKPSLPSSPLRSRRIAEQNSPAVHSIASSTASIPATGVCDQSPKSDESTVVLSCALINY